MREYPTVNPATGNVEIWGDDGQGNQQFIRTVGPDPTTTPDPTAIMNTEREKMDLTRMDINSRYAIGMAQIEMSRQKMMQDGDLAREQMKLDARKIGLSERELDEMIKQFNRKMEEQIYEFDRSEYTKLATTLLTTGAQLRGPEDWLSYNQFTQGGKNLFQTLMGDQPVAQFGAPTGYSAPASVEKILADLGIPVAQRRTITTGEAPPAEMTDDEALDWIWHKRPDIKDLYVKGGGVWDYDTPEGRRLVIRDWIRNNADNKPPVQVAKDLGWTKPVATAPPATTTPPATTPPATTTPPDTTTTPPDGGGPVRGPEQQAAAPATQGDTTMGQLDAFTGGHSDLFNTLLGQRQTDYQRISNTKTTPPFASTIPPGHFAGNNVFGQTRPPGYAGVTTPPDNGGGPVRGYVPPGQNVLGWVKLPNGQLQNVHTGEVVDDGIARVFGNSSAKLPTIGPPDYLGTTTGTPGAPTNPAAQAATHSPVVSALFGDVSDNGTPGPIRGTPPPRPPTAVPPDNSGEWVWAGAPGAEWQNRRTGEMRAGGVVSAVQQGTAPPEPPAPPPIPPIPATGTYRGGNILGAKQALLDWYKGFLTTAGREPTRDEYMQWLTGNTDVTGENAGKAYDYWRSIHAANPSDVDWVNQMNRIQPGLGGQVPLPFQINPAVWDSMSDTAKRMTLAAAAKGFTTSGAWSEQDYLNQMNAARPKGRASGQVNYTWGQPNAFL